MQKITRTVAPMIRARGMCAMPHQLTVIGQNKFGWPEIKEAVSADCYSAFRASVADGSAMDKANANELATAMKKWAMERGAVNYAHWFSPVRGEPILALNGMKHDSFVDLDFSGSEVVKEIKVDFTGSQLFFNETDGSSFPNGGLRATHTAASYNCWDRISPCWVYGDTMYIPSSLVAWTGAALDHKTPLLRSQEAINREGIRLLKHLGDTTATQCVSNCGWEQEVFLVDREMYLKRPDLVMTGRTVLGALPARHQQTDANYFAAMPPRIKAFLEEFSAETQKIGMAMKVYHNEVAPGQHEYSPIFSLTNVANDQNQMATQMSNDIAARHGLVVLHHEKPFKGINGSGKHNNWGLNTDSGKNLYAPGKTEESQADFATFVAALTYAVNVHADVIRCSIAGAGNDHRLGAQEAPPAIISLYTGHGMASHLQAIVEGGPLAGYADLGHPVPSGSNAVQTVAGAGEDRNRTAPLPFCGNRFEFRAVGSSQNIGFPMAVLNTAVADGLSYISDLIEGGKSPRDAVAQILEENNRAIFNGNGYSDEWPVEAAGRGLLNLKNTPEALATWDTQKNRDLFEKHGVFTAAETEARAETLFEQYNAQVQMEASIMLEMMDTGVVPACAEDLKVYEGTTMGGHRATLYNDMTKSTENLRQKLDAIPEEMDDAAKYMISDLIPAMDEARDLADSAEKVCSRELWPFPTYGEVIYTHHSEGF